MEELEGSESEADSRVEAATELASSLDASEKGEHNCQGTSHSIGRWGSPQSLDHQDDTDKDGSQDSFIDEHLDI